MSTSFPRNFFTAKFKRLKIAKVNFELDLNTGMVKGIKYSLGDLSYLCLNRLTTGSGPFGPSRLLSLLEIEVKIFFHFLHRGFSKSVKNYKITKTKKKRKFCQNNFPLVILFQI